MPQRPQPCERALKDDINYRKLGYQGLLCKDAHGAMRCKGYLGMFGDPCEECDHCSFYVNHMADIRKNQPQYEIETIRLPHGDFYYKVNIPMPKWIHEYLDSATDEEREAIEDYIKDAINRYIISLEEKIIMFFDNNETDTTAIGHTCSFVAMASNTVGPVHAAQFVDEPRIVEGDNGE